MVKTLLELPFSRCIDVTYASLSGGLHHARCCAGFLLLADALSSGDSMSALLARVQMTIVQKQEVLCLNKVIHLLTSPEDHHHGGVKLLGGHRAAKLLNLTSLRELLPDLDKCNEGPLKCLNHFG